MGEMLPDEGAAMIEVDSNLVSFYCFMVMLELDSNVSFIPFWL